MEAFGTGQLKAGYGVGLSMHCLDPSQVCVDWMCERGPFSSFSLVKCLPFCLLSQDDCQAQTATEQADGPLGTKSSSRGLTPQEASWDPVHPAKGVLCLKDSYQPGEPHCPPLASSSSELSIGGLWRWWGGATLPTLHSDHRHHVDLLSAPPDEEHRAQLLRGGDQGARGHIQ